MHRWRLVFPSIRDHVHENAVHPQYQAENGGANAVHRSTPSTMKTLALIALLAIPGCIRYAEYPTQYGVARYVNIGFATTADKISLRDPTGASLEVDGVKSDSAKAIDALAELAKTAAKVP